MLTVEPSPDNSPAPFSIKPLIDTVVEDVGPGVLQSMENLYADNPSGTVRTR